MQLKQTQFRGGPCGSGSAWQTQPLSTSVGCFSSSWAAGFVVWCWKTAPGEPEMWLPEREQGESSPEPSRAAWGPSCWSAQCPVLLPRSICWPVPEPGQVPAGSALSLFSHWFGAGGSQAFVFPCTAGPAWGQAPFCLWGSHSGRCLREAFLVALWWIPFCG